MGCSEVQVGKDVIDEVSNEYPDFFQTYVKDLVTFRDLAIKEIASVQATTTNLQLIWTQIKQKDIPELRKVGEGLEYNKRCLEILQNFILNNVFATPPSSGAKEPCWSSDFSLPTISHLLV